MRALLLVGLLLLGAGCGHPRVQKVAPLAADSTSGGGDALQNLAISALIVLVLIPVVMGSKKP